ncbi:TIGR03085 family metal-binding protein [Planotetraspora phitsanulokensis]|uniref:TIGR03085 family protein n=1 Tax=Planotetraspora phitsanulokensis TaxID=575192 RepID=A0A8J3U0Z8_9ACTN|nr:TIGR03085 family metal-binding protein [Planotetraspora phitsanulokensis]GII35431.1 TIGR03085 family protein [Planotetraspora phitsanulokensis]
MSFVRDERAAISTTLDELGPDAPTLCEGWTTADLAAHLVLRERRPDAAGGIALSFLSGYTGSVQNHLKNGRPYAQLVQFVRQGPPIWSPYRVPGLDRLVNSVELFVHHEDVRRAQPGWEPRELPPESEEALWQQLKSGARLFMRKSPVGVVFRRTAGGEVVAKKATPEAVVTGDTGELILFAFGRGEHARVTFEGDADAVRRLRETRLGM